MMLKKGLRLARNSTKVGRRAYVVRRGAGGDLGGQVEQDARRELLRRVPPARVPTPKARGVSE
eukprot:6192775-Pleurochrysis_carterae.AAC.1